MTQRVVASGLWLAALAGTGRAIGLLRLVFLTHLLGPQEFGMVGAALVTIGLLEALSELGLYLAMLQREDTSRELLDTAWTLGVIRGALVASVTFLGAPWISDAFASPEAVGVVRAMAFVPFVGSFANVGMVEFRRQLAFGRYYAIQASAVMADLLVAVPLALLLRSAWAIVGGWLALSVTRVVLSFVLHPYRPRLWLERARVWDLLAYGRWITGSAALQWATGEGVAAIVGRVFGLEGLGLYQMAWRVTGQPASEAATLISTTTVSAYARLQASVRRAALAYLRVLRVTALCVVPSALLLALYAEEVVTLLFGPRWRESVGLVRILAAFAVVSVIAVVTAPVFQGIGRPRDHALVSFAEALALAVSLPVALSALGLRGAAVAMFARGTAAACVSLWLVRCRLGMSWRELLAAAMWPLAAGLPLVMLRFGAFAGTLGPTLLAKALLTSVLSYLAGIFLLDRLRLFEVGALLRWEVPPSSRPSTDVAERP